MTSTSPNLAGTVAVVTGASRGLGKGMAEEFSRHGLRLGVCARTIPPAPAHTEAVSMSVDVTDAAAVGEFADEVVARFGRIDVWVNNAGVLAPIGPLADADPDALRRHVDVNVLGVLYGSAAFARHVRDRPGRGVLVNISSGAACTTYVGWAPYCASKAAVEMMTRVLDEEGRDHGLRAYALAPGVVDTSMQELIRSTSPEDFPAVDRFLRHYREGTFNSPSWVARYVLDHLVGGQGSNGPGTNVREVCVRVPDERGA